MSVTRAQKTAMLEALTKLFQEGKSIFFSEYKGLPVKSLQKLRRELRGKNVQYKVAKKTLIRLAASKIGFDALPDELMSGTVAVAVSFDDPLAPAQVLHRLSKEFTQLKLLGGIFEHQILNAEQAKTYAVLPSREELLVKFIFVLQSPVQKFHDVLSNLLGGFVRAVDAYRMKAYPMKTHIPTS